MKLKIYQAGEPILRQKAKLLTDEEIKSDFTKHLIELMRDTMCDFPGIGLAAPQVGVAKQIIIIELPAEMLASLPKEILQDRQIQELPFQVIINPVITSKSVNDENFLFETCLSINGYRAIVPRHKSIIVECLNELGEQKTIEASGWYSRILQHEIDHLEGKLYIDKMYSKSFISQELYVKQKWDFKPTSEIQQHITEKE